MSYEEQVERALRRARRGRRLEPDPYMSWPQIGEILSNEIDRLRAIVEEQRAHPLIQFTAPYPYTNDPAPWRVGGKVGRTIYEQLGNEPGDDDPLIGMMDTVELAAEAVRAHNQSTQRQSERDRVLALVLQRLDAVTSAADAHKHVAIYEAAQKLFFAINDADVRHHEAAEPVARALLGEGS